MEYPKYTVSISYFREYASGQTLSNIGGTTFSLPTYSGGFYVASMQIANLVATGSTYEDALDNLLAVATASSTKYPGYPYYQ